MSFAPLVIAAALAFFSLSAAAQEPPMCSDKQATEMVRELFWESKLDLKTVPKPSDGRAWLAYNDFPVVDVVSNGYDSGLKRRSCSAGIGKGRSPLQVSYTVQSVESNSSRFIVRADFSSMPAREAMVLRELIVQAINTPAR